MPAEPKINPAWLQASHIALIVGQGAPSLEDQLQADRDAQAQALRSLPKAERRQYRQQPQEGA